MRKGLGELLERAELVNINGLVTLTEATHRKKIAYHTLRKWLVDRPDIPLLRIGPVLLIAETELEKYHE
jgi:hypothetical protein